MSFIQCSGVHSTTYPHLPAIIHSFQQAHRRRGGEFFTGRPAEKRKSVTGAVQWKKENQLKKKG